MANKKVTVDFTGVDTSGGGSVRIPEGDYGVKIKKAELKTGTDSGKKYIKLQFTVIKGDPAGLKKLLFHNCSLQTQSLWNLKNLIESCGKQVPSKSVSLDIEKMVGWECAATVIDEEYEKKKKSVISAFFPMADLSVGSSKKSKKEEPEEMDSEETPEEEESTEETSDEAEELFE